MHMQLAASTPRSVFAVFASPAPEHEVEFNRWYDEIHGPDALANGSFSAVHRFRAVGPGHRPAPYLALWEAPYGSEAEAWAYIGPRAQALREAGRAGGELASVRFALMLVAASSEHGPGLESVGSLATIQNDWRDAKTAPPARTWWHSLPLGEWRAPVRWLATSDAEGRGPGYHLAILASASPPAAGVMQTSTSSAIAQGMSPLPPYQTIFGTTVGNDEDELPRARAWRMQWVPVSSQRA